MRQHIQSIKLIALDMDGTLLMSDKTVHPDTIRAIEEAAHRGISVAYCTGRAVPELASYVDILSAMRFGVCLAGALVYDFHDKRVIYKRSLNPVNVRSIIETSVKYDAMAQFLTADRSIVRRDQEACMADFNIGEYQNLFDKITAKVDDLSAEVRRSDAILKANVHFRTVEDRQAAYEELKRLRMTPVFSETSTLEIMPEGVSKASGLSMLARCLGIPMLNVMAIGDGNNDRDMLKAVGFSVAMGNAWDDMKTDCDAVTEDNDHNGVGIAIRRYTEKN